MHSVSIFITSFKDRNVLSFVLYFFDSDELQRILHFFSILTWISSFKQMQQIIFQSLEFPRA